MHIGADILYNAVRWGMWLVVLFPPQQINTGRLSYGSQMLNPELTREQELCVISTLNGQKGPKCHSKGSKGIIGIRVWDGILRIPVLHLRKFSRGHF